MHRFLNWRDEKLLITVQLPTEPGIYRYGLCVDALPNESNTCNN